MQKCMRYFYAKTAGRKLIMITIKMDDNNIAIWKSGEYSDYIYDGSAKYFIVVDSNGNYIGLYNLEHVRNIVIEPEVAK